MKKLLTCLGLVMAVAASGCTLYFGPGDDDGGNQYYSYCDSTGCWTCDSVSGECWPQGGGSVCYTDQDCAAGCYCDTGSGQCIETGFCSYDTDCPQGYHCDERASCVPDGGPTYCWDTGCPIGQYCDNSTGACTVSTTCNTDADCDSGSSCSNGTCTPVCAAGCYYDPTTGSCIESGYCTVDTDCANGDICDTTRSTCIPNPNPPPPACDTLTDQTSCDARGDCHDVWTGINCTPECANDPNDPACTCQSYVWAACAAN